MTEFKDSIDELKELHVKLGEFISPDVIENKKKIEEAQYKILRDKDKPLTREIINFKMNNIREEIDVLEESLHYARQDVEFFQSNLEISNRAVEARRALEDTERQVAELRKEYSRLNAL